MISVKNPRHLEKEGRHLFIDVGCVKKNSMLIITKTEGLNFIPGCLIRAMTADSAKKLKLKRFIPLTEETFAMLGPFFIRIDKTISEDEINVVVEENGMIFYFFNNVPLKPRIFSENDILLLQAENYFGNINEVAEFLKFSGIKKGIISGCFADKFISEFSFISFKKIESAVQMEIKFE